MNKNLSDLPELHIIVPNVSRSSRSRHVPIFNILLYIVTADSTRTID